MEVGPRTDLKSSRISTLPKRDTRRAISDYVDSLRTFSRVHAAEGEAHMASWDGKEVVLTTTPAEACPQAQSCGFATPVLKPRKPLAQTIKPSKPQPQSRDILKDSKASDRTGTKNSAKPIGATKSKEPSSTRRADRSTKRSRELQSDEEKRLDERRENKRARRAIMKPRPSKQDEDRSEGTPKSRSKKSKQKLPAGLALMHGLTASNVGKNRLTLDPPFRPGVFGKGKVSGAGRKVSQFKVQGIEDLLQANSRNPRRGRRQSSSSAHSLSRASSDRSHDEPKQNERKRASPPTEAGRTEFEGSPIRKTQKKKLKPRGKEPGKNPKPQSSDPLPEDDKSIVWDIEKASGVLPTDDISILSHGEKVSTLLLNVNREEWLPKLPETLNIDVEISSKEQASVIGDEAARRLEPSQETASSISSLRPSESPSQDVQAGEPRSNLPTQTVSKFFNPVHDLQAHSQHESFTRVGAEPRSPLDTPEQPDRILPVHTTPAIPGSTKRPPPVGMERKDLPDLLHQANASTSKELGYSDLVAEGTPQNFPPTKVDSDWLLSDPISNGISKYEFPSGSTDAFFLMEAEETNFLDSPTGYETLGLWSEFQGDFFSSEDLGREGEIDYLDFVSRKAASEMDDSRVYDCGELGASTFSTFSGGSEGELWAEDPDALDCEVVQTYGFLDNEESANGYLKIEQDFSSDPDYCSSLSFASNEPSYNDDTVSHATEPLHESSFMHFNEGRCLLLTHGTEVAGRSQTVLKSIEADVARRLVGHWAPQKY